MIVTAACGSGSDDGDEIQAGQSPSAGPGVIPAALTGRVVAGDETGWLADGDGQVWRISADGAVTQTDVEIPTYNSGFSTYFAGQVVFAGTRCDGEVEGENCDGEAVVELRLVDEADQSVETVELFREPGSRYRSVGVGVLGPTNDGLLVQSDVGEVSIVVDGDVDDLDVEAGADRPTPCMVGGELYGLTKAPPGPSEDPGTDSSPEPTAYDPGAGAPGGEETWTVSRWDGSTWTPVSGGVYSRRGEEASMTCLAEGFVVHSYAMDTTHAVWTPDGGWQTPQPSLASLNLRDLLVSSTHTGYLVQLEGIQRVDVGSGIRPTSLTEARLGEDLVGPTIDVVDDAGALLAACGMQDTGQTQCVVTSDD